MSALISPSKGEKSWAFPLLYLIQLLISMAPPFMCKICNGCQLPLKAELDASVPAAVGDAKPSKGQEGGKLARLTGEWEPQDSPLISKGCGPPQERLKTMGTLLVAVR